MNIRSISLAFVLALSLNTTFAQAPAPKPAAPVPSPVVPAARTEERIVKRFNELTERVKNNQGKLDLLFVGDSITQGWEGNGKEVWQKYYGKKKALNIGIGGDWTQHVLYRLDHGHADGIRPKVTVLMIGTNNSADDRHSAEEMVQGVTAVVNKLKEKFPKTKILLLGIFPRGEKFNNQRGKILQVNQAIQKLADDKSVFYYDFGHLLINADGTISKEIMPDYLHLSPQGYEIWAKAIQPKLKKLL